MIIKVKVINGLDFLIFVNSLNLFMRSLIFNTI